MITTKIDYLTLTRVFKNNPLQGRVLSYFGAESLASDIVLDITGQSGRLIASKPQKNYAFTFEDGITGALISIADDLLVQGVRVVFSGRALQRVSDPNYMLERAMLAGWKITRLDLAVDVKDGMHTVEEYIKVYEALHGDNTRRSWEVKHSPTGKTLYIGSRKSARYLRIYDKAGEQGVSGNWLRFEIEYKDYAPVQAAMQYIQDAGFIYREILDMMKFPTSALTEAFEELAQEVEHSPLKAPKTESKRVVWFKGQVTQAFEKIVLDDPLEALECLAGIEEMLLEAYAKWMSK